MKLFVSSLIFFCVISCSEEDYVKPTQQYQADFNTDNIDSIEEYIKSIAKRWNLRVFEKSHNEMKLLTQGQDAFYIALYLNENAVLDISNVGVGTILTLETFDHGDLPPEKLSGLTDEIVQGLEQQIGIQLNKIESTKINGLRLD